MPIAILTDRRRQWQCLSWSILLGLGYHVRSVCVRGARARQIYPIVDILPSVNGEDSYRLCTLAHTMPFVVPYTTHFEHAKTTIRIKRIVPSICCLYT